MISFTFVSVVKTLEAIVASVSGVKARDIRNDGLELLYRLLKSLLRSLQAVWSKKQVVFRYALNPGSPATDKPGLAMEQRCSLYGQSNTGAIMYHKGKKEGNRSATERFPLNSCESLCRNVAKIIHRGRRVAIV